MLWSSRGTRISCRPRKPARSERGRSLIFFFSLFTKGRTVGRVGGEGLDGDTLYIHFFTRVLRRSSGGQVFHCILRRGGGIHTGFIMVLTWGRGNKDVKLFVLHGALGLRWA